MNIGEQKLSKEDEIAEAWAKPTAHNEWKEMVVESARKWVKCKGRYHSEQNMNNLVELFKQEPKP